MNPMIDLTIFAAVWAYVYMMSADAVKLLAKHAIYLSLITALYEGGTLYGNTIYALMGLVIVLWFITLIFDYLEGVRKPAGGMIKETQSLR